MQKLILFTFFITINLCSQWIQVNNGLSNRQVNSLVKSGNILFAGTWPDSGVYISTNYGLNWVRSSLNTFIVNSFTIQQNNIFVNTYLEGIFLSTNYGQNWNQTFLNNYDVKAFVINNSNYIAGNGHLKGIYTSTNFGLNWNQALNNVDVNDIVAKDNYIFAGTTNNGIYQSSNNGLSWSLVPINTSTVYSLSTELSIIVAAAYRGVFLSTNNGLYWFAIDSNYQVPIPYSVEIMANNIFVGTMGYSVFFTSNNGDNWLHIDQGMNNARVTSLCVLNEYIFAGTTLNGVYRRHLSEIIGLQNISEEIPDKFFLSQNFPNPFNPITNINFGLPQKTFVKLVIFDLQGREVLQLVNNELSAGLYNIDFDASHLPSSVYFYSIVAKNFFEVKKMVLVK